MINFRKIGVHIRKPVDHLVTTSARRTCRTRGCHRKGDESANNDARKWPILPFDVSRDFIIIKQILVYRETFHWIIF